MKTEWCIIVKGLVQGVSFRALVEQRAHVYHLCGYVKNLKDRSVEICVQGDPNMIENFLKSLEEDSGHAKIEEISKRIQESSTLFSSFVILR